TTDINDSQWHHIVGSYDGTSMKIYIDGNLEDTNTDFSGNLPTNDGNVRIGADYQPTPDNFFSGLIDEARIYNRALSADEIGELYRVGARRFQAN
ncbi:MAG: LamG domain-containing protein, partial [Candidatus Falkowbacteria bacterium]